MSLRVLCGWIDSLSEFCCICFIVFSKAKVF